MKKTMRSGPVQKSGSSAQNAGTPPAYVANARLPLHPALQRATFKSQGKKEAK